MTWDGKERRTGNGHDLLIRIDANLTNHMKRMEDHVKEDAKSFEVNKAALEKYDDRIKRLEIWGSMAVGGLATLQVILSIFRR